MKTFLLVVLVSTLALASANKNNRQHANRITKLANYDGYSSNYQANPNSYNFDTVYRPNIKDYSAKLYDPRGENANDFVDIYYKYDEKYDTSKYPKYYNSYNSKDGVSYRTIKDYQNQAYSEDGKYDNGGYYDQAMATDNQYISNYPSQYYKRPSYNSKFGSSSYSQPPVSSSDSDKYGSSLNKYYQSYDSYDNSNYYRPSYSSPSPSYPSPSPSYQPPSYRSDYNSDYRRNDYNSDYRRNDYNADYRRSDYKSNDYNRRNRNNDYKRKSNNYRSNNKNNRRGSSKYSNNKRRY